MSNLRLLVCLNLLAALCWARGELWTNQAGRVIEAQLESFDGVCVALLRTNGASVRMPLAALSKSDQHRVRQQMGLWAAPPLIQAAYVDARNVLNRFEHLPAQQRTPESREKAVHMACAIFDARVRRHCSELEDKAVSEEIKRLRSLLANHGIRRL